MKRQDGEMREHSTFQEAGKPHFLKWEGAAGGGFVQMTLD